MDPLDPTNQVVIENESEFKRLGMAQYSLSAVRLVLTPRIACLTGLGLFPRFIGLRACSSNFCCFNLDAPFGPCSNCIYQISLDKGFKLWGCWHVIYLSEANGVVGALVFNNSILGFVRIM